MAGNSDIFQTVRNAVDIVDVIAEHLVLKRAGKEFKCLCPFHDDHRPSMAVVPQKQIFHCFVCGTGGDVFKFVMNYHKMTAGEALRYLAQKAGIVLPELPSRRGPHGSHEEKSAREVITETNERACAYFEKLLHAEGGQAGWDYLHRRGLTDGTIAQFRLGFSPEGWTGLVTAAGRVGLRGDHLEMAGLVKKRGDGSFYDAFRGRVMFPIFDATSRIIAFGGRVLEEKRDEAGNVIEAKYLNSPETRVFNKSESLYGLNFAKRAIIETETVIVVEGYMDVIACHQAGVTNVVATLGTALTPEHAKVLRRFCQTVVLIFDSDEAGYRAADRAMETFVREPLDVKIASVPDGKDPCDFCMSHGGEAFKKVVASATDAMSYQWARLQREFRTTESLSARQAATGQFMRFVAAAMQANGREMDPIRRGLLMTKIAALLGVSVNEVSTMLRGLGRAPGPAREPVRNASAGTSAEPAGALSGRAAAEGWVLGALLTQPSLYIRVREEMDLGLFGIFRPLAERIMEYLENAPELASCSLTDFCALLPPEDGEWLSQAIRLQQEVEASGDAAQNLIDGWKRLAEQRQQERVEKVGDDKDVFAKNLEALRGQQARGEVKRFVPRKW